MGRKTQHRSERDGATGRLVQELKSEIKSLKREVARLKKQLAKQEEVELYNQESEPTVSLPPEPPKPACPLCGGTNLSSYTTPRGKRVYGCKSCKKPISL